MVESALMLPLLLLLIFGMVEFSRAYNAKVTVTHAAREGVRVLAITGDPVAAADAAEGAGTSLDPASMTITNTPCVPAQPTELTVSYPFTYEIPFFGTNTLTLQATGVMRCSG
ncbi:MAG: pilus assembly protein [Acidimicrobiia bacterium]|nr:pilus assembly protein [Acidimicrobiia bacterium]